MGLEQIPDFSESIKTHLRRSVWGDFPDVVIHSDVPLVKKHPLYNPAKAGDADAAEGLVLQTISDAALDRIRKIIGTEKPYLLAVHALETEGMNAIPRVLAQVLSVKLTLIATFKFVRPRPRGRTNLKVAITGKAYSANLRLSEETLQGLREKHGTELEKWWTTTFGYSFERLTESEAKYLYRADNAHVISKRIIAARGKGD